MSKTKSDLLQGTLDMLILKTLALEPMHGWGISQRIQQGWISSEWDKSDNNRQAKYYSLTRAGRKQLSAETENWERLSSAINQILQTS